MAHWDRLLWGVEFSDKRDRFLIGESWRQGPWRALAYPGEPSRALLFTTRRLAREYCAEKHAHYAGRTDCCSEWRFRAVRVRERVEKVRKPERA